MVNPKNLLNSAKKILLIDWRDATVPRTLVDAGFTVFCYSPNGYTQAEVLDKIPTDVNAKNILPPKNNEKGYLVFRPLSVAPDSIDIVNIYRPEAEHSQIIAKHVLPLHANVIWLQSLTSETTRSLANECGLTFIEGHDIADVARQ